MEKLLPVAAALLMGRLANETRAPLDRLSRAFGGGPLPLPDEAPVRTGPVDPAPRAPAPTSAPRNQTGNVGRQQPLPIPGEVPSGRPGDNPYGDLSDAIRRNKRVPVPDAAPDSGSGPLSTSIRDILGKVLGFDSNGFLSWLIRVVLVPIGLRLLQRILGRMLTGR